MLLNIAIENFRQVLDFNNLPSDDDAVKAFRADVLNQLDDWQSVHTQRVGSGVILQSGTLPEREAFDAAVERSLEAVTQ